VLKSASDEGVVWCAPLFVLHYNPDTRRVSYLDEGWVPCLWPSEHTAHTMYVPDNSGCDILSGLIDFLVPRHRSLFNNSLSGSRGSFARFRIVPGEMSNISPASSLPSPLQNICKSFSCWICCSCVSICCCQTCSLAFFVRRRRFACLRACSRASIVRFGIVAKIQKKE